MRIYVRFELLFAKQKVIRKLDHVCVWMEVSICLINNLMNGTTTRFIFSVQADMSFGDFVCWFGMKCVSLWNFYLNWINTSKNSTFFLLWLKNSNLRHFFYYSKIYRKSLLLKNFVCYKKNAISKRRRSKKATSAELNIKCHVPNICTSKYFFLEIIFLHSLLEFFFFLYYRLWHLTLVRKSWPFYAGDFKRFYG